MASSVISILLTSPRFAAQEHFTFTSTLWGNANAPDRGGRKMPKILILLLLLLLAVHDGFYSDAVECWIFVQRVAGSILGRVRSEDIFLRLLHHCEIYLHNYAEMKDPVVVFGNLFITTESLLRLVVFRPAFKLLLQK